MFICSGGGKQLSDNLQAVCPYPAALDVVEFLLQTFFDTGGFFKRDEDETPPFLCFVVSGELSGFNLEGKFPVRGSSHSVLNETSPESISKNKNDKTLCGKIQFWQSSVILETMYDNTDLSKRLKIFPDGFLRCLWIQASDKDLHRLFLHGHRFLGVN